MYGNEDPLDPMEYGEAARSISKSVEEYPGYENPEERRISDESIRAAIVMALEDLLAHIPSLDSYLAGKNLLIHLENLRDAEERLELARDRIESPPYTISLFFTVRRMPEEILERILGNDWELIQLTNQIQAILQRTLSDQTDFGALIGRLSAIADDLDEHLEVRFSALCEFQG